MRYFIPILFLSILSTSSLAQRSIAIKGVADATLFSELDDAIATYGAGLEARIGSKWSLGGDFSWGSFERVNVFSFRPELRYYFSKTFSGLYLKGGTGFYTFKTEGNNLLPSPFDIDDGEETNFMTLSAGLGLNTVVLNRLNIGVHLTIGGTFDTALEEYVNAGFSVGYLF